MTSTTSPAVDLCFALTNHWSYTGIGWTLGLESCAASIADSLTMADYSPSVKTGMNLDALAYEMVVAHYPELVERLKRYLDDGRVEIIGGTFGQPMGSMVSGESNLRQLVVGQQTIRAALGGRGVAVFLEEEEMSHPQIPQLVTLAGYKYASLAQCDTWGRHGAPKIERNVIRWQGVDGTTIVATPANAMVFHPPMVTHDIDWLWGDAGRAKLAEMNRTLGQPALAIKWTEFGWESLSGKSMNKFDAALFKTLSEKFRVDYVTIEQYLDRYAKNASSDEVTRLRMDDFEKLLPWGVGGDQIRRFGREVEADLVEAERFDAIAHARGLETAPDALENLRIGWRELLAAQSHDVSLCEYSRWQGLPPPRDPLFDSHFLTWGSRGYGHMDRAALRARPVRKASIESIAQAVNTQTVGNCILAAVAFNGTAFDRRDAIVTTGKIQLGGRGARTLRVRDVSGRELPSQLLEHTTDSAGVLVTADVAFGAKNLPSIGYETFYVEPSGDAGAPATTDLRIDEKNLRLENAHVTVTLDAVTGAIASLIDRKSGKEMLDGRRRAFPTLTGRSNVEAIPKRHRNGIPDSYDSSKSQAEIKWIERGPLRATVRVAQSLPWLSIELYVTLCADSPSVQVHARLFPGVPPLPGEGNINGWQFDLDIVEGYWFEFAPAFTPASFVRDYPFGVEPCGKKAIDALTFLDLLDGDGSGLLISHSGSQYFKRKDDGVIANLAVREWESHYTGEYGWPRACEYHYALTPHDAAITNRDRLRLSAEIDHKPRCVVLPPREGKLPTRQSFVRMEGDGGAIVSAMRRVTDDVCELRAFECEGRSATARIVTSLSFSQMRSTNALGEPTGDAQGIKESVSLRPWEIQNRHLKA